MDKKRLLHLEGLLQKEERRIENTIRSMKKNNAAEQGIYSPSELSNYDNHPADLGTELYLVEMNSALKVHEENQLKDIKDALTRIDEGRYGTCIFCGKDIDTERLEVIPYTKLCTDCEERRVEEHNNHGTDRPVEEKIWDAPFGRKYLNKREDDEHEGMDQLNDLLKYGSSDTPQDMGGYHDYDEFYTNEIDKQGIVDDMDKVSNEEYKRQLPD